MNFIQSCVAEKMPSNEMIWEYRIAPIYTGTLSKNHNNFSQTLIIISFMATIKTSECKMCECISRTANAEKRAEKNEMYHLRCEIVLFSSNVIENGAKPQNEYTRNTTINSFKNWIFQLFIHY